MLKLVYKIRGEVKMADLSQRHAKEARDRLAEVAKEFNFNDYTNMHIITQVEDNGFMINGKFGG